ncbi:MAG: hypothetical protein AAF456_11070 [Planctomycetota bacterium]
MKVSIVSLIVGSLIAAVLIFFWGFVFWAQVTAPEWALKGVPEEHLEEVNVAVRNLEHGTYITPFQGQVEGESPEGWMDRHREGPLMMLSVVPDGAKPMEMTGMIQGFVHGWIAAFTAAIVLAMAAPALPAYGQRFAFVLMLGAFTTIWAEPAHSIWWWRTCGASTWFAFYGMGAWLVAAIALAAFVKVPVRKP